MKSLWNSFKIAFSMFSKIPMPQAEWTKENMKYMFCFFPFIGLVTGAVFTAVALAASFLGFDGVFRAGPAGDDPRADNGRDPCGRPSGYGGRLKFLAGERTPPGNPERLPCRGFCGDHRMRLFQLLFWRVQPDRGEI